MMIKHLVTRIIGETLTQKSTSMRGRMVLFAFLPLFVLLQVSCVEAGDYCTYSYSYSSSLYSPTRWCDHGCCGDKYESYDNVCCSNVGVIAGSVTGSLILIGIVIGVIICCVQSHNRSRGVVIHPSNAPQTVVVQGTTQMPYGAYPGPPGPPGYTVAGPSVMNPSQVSSTTIITSK